MRSLFVRSCLGAFLAVPSLAFGARTVALQVDAFSRVYPVAYAKSMVFSPASFEIDCALMGESLETIPKANVSERLGVVIDFESSYRPVLDGLSAWTNGFVFTAARGFCVPDTRRIRPAFRQYLEHVYGAEVFRHSAREGSEAWFRTTMGGRSEDFSLPPEASNRRDYCLYDLVAVEAAWAEPFPTANTRQIPFRRGDGAEPLLVPCMSDVRRADVWSGPDGDLLKLPLRGGASFFAYLPKEGVPLASLRAKVSSRTLPNLLAVTTSLTADGVWHGPCVIVLPRLELTSRADFRAACEYFKIPTAGLSRLDSQLAAGALVQTASFRLAEHAADEPPVGRKPPERVLALTPDARRLVFNRPFLFFVYHEQTTTLPVIGQFTGD